MANEDIKVLYKEGVYVSDIITLGDCRGDAFCAVANSLNYKPIRDTHSIQVFAKNGVSLVYEGSFAVLIGNQKTEMYASEIVKAIQESQTRMTSGRRF